MIIADAIAQSIEKLSLASGDLVVLTYPDVLSSSQRSGVVAGISTYLPTGARALVLDGGLTIASLTPAQIALLAPKVRAKVKVCGVDCFQGDSSCNGYCTGKCDRPPAADVVLAAPVESPRTRQLIAGENTYESLLAEMDECGASGWAYRLRELRTAEKSPTAPGPMRLTHVHAMTLMSGYKTVSMDAALLSNGQAYRVLAGVEWMERIRPVIGGVVILAADGNHEYQPPGAPVSI